MALIALRNRLGPWARPQRLVAVLLSAGIGLVLQAPAASAAPFTGVCPVLGATQPPYPEPLPPVNPPLPGLPLAIPQVPVRVTVAGQELPICAVYMSINESLRPVADAVAELSQSTNLILPAPVTTDLLFPDLRAQPWYTAPGGSFAQAMASALVENGFWDVGGTKHEWADEGQGFLVNENPSQQPNDSTYSAYFLWDEVGGASNLKGKSRVLWYNTVTDVGPDGMINWHARDNPDLDPNTRYWFWVLDAPGGETEVPGPVPLLGAAAAFRSSRRLRRRLAAAQPAAAGSARRPLRTRWCRR